MLSTMVLIIVCLALFLVSFVLWAVFLRVGLRWAKVEEITTRRVIYATAVGLPGEEILIKDGAVWANGTKLTPPDSIREMKHVSEFSHPRITVWGSAGHPAQLAADEYFVLGDFSANSEDSRFWTQGAPGHNPFAVPASYMRGIVTHICWPPQRWCVLR